MIAGFLPIKPAVITAQGLRQLGNVPVLWRIAYLPRRQVAYGVNLQARFPVSVLYGGPLLAPYLLTRQSLALAGGITGSYFNAGYHTSFGALPIAPDNYGGHRWPWSTFRWFNPRSESTPPLLYRLSTSWSRRVYEPMTPRISLVYWRSAFPNDLVLA